jgi:hypothetical protein
VLEATTVGWWEEEWGVASEAASASCLVVGLVEVLVQRWAAALVAKSALVKEEELAAKLEAELAKA